MVSLIFSLPLQIDQDVLLTIRQKVAYIVEIKHSGIIPAVLERNTINAKSVKELTTNFQNGTNK